MRQCIKMGLGFLPLMLALVVLFQNCSEQPMSSSQLSSQAFKSAPFAYDATVDTMAYMSCSQMNSSYDPRAFFTFKVGSYTAGSGLSLTSAFTNAMKYYTSADRLKALQFSVANAGAWLQMSLRQKNNLQNMLADGGAEPDQEYYSFLQNLDSEPVANVLLGLSANAKARYFNAIQDTPSRFMEGSIRFLGNEGVAVSIRDQATSLQAILALTYTNSSDMEDTNARSPSAAGNKAYGTGYMLTFNNEVGVTSGMNRVLGSVREMDLATGATAGGNLRNWSCPVEYRFMIVRRQDVIAAINAGQAPPCQMTTVDDTSSQANASIVEMVRRVLPVDYWHLDLANRCIVPKQNLDSFSCYGTRPTNAPAIAYSRAVTTCDASNCPHFLTVCARL